MPKLKNYKQFCFYSKRRFHGVSIAVKQDLVKHVIRIPHENYEGFEIVHLRINDVAVPTNLLGVYQDVESRCKSEMVKQSWAQLMSIANDIIHRGEGLILLGDLNRPLMSENVSQGTKLLVDWLEEGNVKLLNDSTPTRIDPHSGKGSVLDLAIVSKNISYNVKDLVVDTNMSFTPYSITKKGDKIIKKFTDHRAMILQISLPLAITNSKPSKIPVIDVKNVKKWDNYSEISDKYAKEMSDIIENNDDVNVIERKLAINNLLLQIECFGIKWVSKGKKQKKRNYKELKELYEEQMGELDDLIDKGVQGKDLMSKIYQIKKLSLGSKVKSQDPMAINDPITGELITDADIIKNVSLEHNLKILTKNKPRDCDLGEYMEKQSNHSHIMNKSNTDIWELDRETFDIVVKKIILKDKNMYKELIRSGPAFKDAISVGLLNIPILIYFSSRLLKKIRSVSVFQNCTHIL